MLRQKGGRLFPQQTCEKSQLVRLSLMISLPISLKAEKGHTATTNSHKGTRGQKGKGKKKCDKSNRVSSSGFSSSLALFTDNVYRRCLANGTWALKGNYSMCKAILHEEVRVSCLHVSWLMRPLGRILKVWSLLHGNRKQTKARLVVEDAALLEAYWNIYSKYDFGVCLPADKRNITENTAHCLRASL